jgi:2-C-methyl-D-erythritol 4-phosphate cytidylyltransferase
MLSNTKIVAVVPAAGAGTRMQSLLPKQYLKIDQHTIIEYTIHKLISCDEISRVVVAISPNDDVFETLPLAQHPKIMRVYGGNTRAESVLAGLAMVHDDEWALVHDAARPCVSHEDIQRLISTVVPQNQGGILAIPMVDTIKLASDQHNNTVDKTLDRSQLWAAMTPQLFLSKTLKAALTKALQNGATITDEASAIEYCGQHPILVLGRRDNIKITYPEDLALARFYLNQQFISD